MNRMIWLLALIMFAIPMPTVAEVVDQSPGGFTVRTVVTISEPADRVFGALVQDIGMWWDSAHTFSRDARNLRLTPNPGGCLCETLANGGGVQHAVVIHVVPGALLRLTGAFGPMQASAVVGTLTWQFAPTPQGSATATVTYTASGSYPGGLDKIAGAVDAMIGDQLRRLKSYVERSTR